MVPFPDWSVFEGTLIEIEIESEMNLKIEWKQWEEGLPIITFIKPGIHCDLNRKKSPL